MKNILLFILIFILSYCNCDGQEKYVYYSKSNLDQDLDFFKKNATSIHPLFLDKEYLNNWEAKIEQIKTSLKDSMTQNEFYLSISPMLAGLKDAHSNFLCPMNQRIKFMKNSGLAFPFDLEIKNNVLLIAQYYGDDSTLFDGGEEILQLNNIKSDEIIRNMQQLTGAKSTSIQNKTIAYYFRTYLWMIYEYSANYELVVKNRHDLISTHLIPGVTNQQFFENKKRYSPPKPHDYEVYLDSIRNTSTITIRTFAQLNSFCDFADSAFQIIAAKNIENLIIDIRGNSGGRSIVVDSLMNYLTDQEYTQYQTIETRISNELRNYYEKEYPEKFTQIKDYDIDELVISSGLTITPHLKKSRFKGNLFLLTDDKTFSAAATFAGLFKEKKLGITIGEETGGTIEYYGDFWFQELPNTGLQYYISPKRFVQYGGSEKEKGVKPDFVVAHKKDSTMSFTYRLIEKQSLD